MGIFRCTRRCEATATDDNQPDRRSAAGHSGLQHADRDVKRRAVCGRYGHTVAVRLGGRAARSGASARRGRASAHRAAPAARPGGRCAPGDVVPSLFVSQQTYQRWVKPQFSIYLVNIGQTTCTFDVGARSLRLVVRSGQVRVWGSADCAHGAAPHVVRSAARRAVRDLRLHGAVATPAQAAGGRAEGGARHLHGRGASGGASRTEVTCHG